MLMFIDPDGHESVGRCPFETNDYGQRNSGSRHRRQAGFCQWEQIFYFEFDGKRDKRVLVKIIGE